MRILGIDYGKKKVGLAISEGKLAQPFKVIEVSSLEDALVKISAIINKEDITAVIVGLAESGESLKITKNFIKHLKLAFPEMEIKSTDETLSSRRAVEQMVHFGKTKTSRKNDDSFAAAILLQDYLDNES